MRRRLETIGARGGVFLGTDASDSARSKAPKWLRRGVISYTPPRPECGPLRAPQCG